MLAIRGSEFRMLTEWCPILTPVTSQGPAGKVLAGVAFAEAVVEESASFATAWAAMRQLSAPNASVCHCSDSKSSRKTKVGSLPIINPTPQV